MTAGESEMTNDRISSYKAKYDYSYTYTNNFSVTSCNVRTKLATMIYGQWKFSWHFPERHNQWLDKAKEDAEYQLARVKARAKELEDALALLARIDREDE